MDAIELDQTWLEQKLKAGSVKQLQASSWQWATPCLLGLAYKRAETGT